MLFNSLQYFLFLAVVTALVHRAATTVRARNWVLFVGGSVFYGTWSVRFLALLYLTILVDYTVGRLLDRREGRRGAVLLVSLGVNLGVLAVFKYADFFAATIEDVLAAAGASVSLPRLAVPLPLGISFYTFLSLGYVVDVYRRRYPAERSLLAYAVFVTFFPHLIAGPILRGDEFLPQVHSPRPENLRPIPGLTKILVGLVKKTLVADWLARIVEPVYAQPTTYDGVAALVATYSYAFQIYADFSGYADIARGSAELLGYELPINFARPYLAPDITTFWRRWHVSLSSFLRDYVYVPLGGNREGALRTRANLLVTMLIGGLWHGPSWTFVVWGGLHGVMLVVHRWMRERRGRGRSTPLGAGTGAFLTFQLVCLGWVFFRAPTLRAAFDLLGTVAALPENVLRGSLPASRLLVAPAWCAALLAGYRAAAALRDRAERFTPGTNAAWAGYGLACACVLAIIAAGAAPAAHFIYFVF